MREIIKEHSETIKLDIEKDLAFRKLNKDGLLPEKIAQLLTEAHELFYTLAAPMGIIADVTCSRFKQIYRGEGRNEIKTPMLDIMTDEAVYFLFAMTLGGGISRRISDLFHQGNYLLGHFLDEMCSTGIEIFADNLTKQYHHREVTQRTLNENDIIVRYSPGYCGWDISGQQKLHEYIHSRDIGITLTESFYMHPIKSISGVMIGGKPLMHQFKNKFSFCSSCLTKICRKRVAEGIVSKHANLITDPEVDL